MQIAIGLGANLGQKRRTLRKAIAALRRIPSTQRCQVSRFYCSAPVEATGPDYINVVARLHNRLGPHRLLQALQRIEVRHGRVRSYLNAPRTLDLDLLLYGARRVRTPRLTVPHPRLTERAFVLVPLIDLQPRCWIPGKGCARLFLRAVQSQRVDSL